MKSLHQTKVKIVCAVLFACISLAVKAQQDSIKLKKDNSYSFGNGLNFSFNQLNYQFHLGGFIQPFFSYQKADGMKAENKFNSRRAFLNVSGNAIKEKVSFLVQLDYSLSQPLLDAWVAYHPHKSTKITFGQKQTFVNNREMIYREDKLQFTNRSPLSGLLSNTGREFGFFVESNFGNSFGFSPKLAVTSGDGRNSFGDNSTDLDLGGLKIGGRLDLYPLGYFKQGNDLTSVDLEREDSIKFLIGMAASINNGVSNANGEGHGDFILYDAKGNKNLADYNQIYTDFLLKYRGFSLMFEYASTSASNLKNNTYLDDESKQILVPTQISEFLFLGDSYNFQTGYITKNGFSIDFRYNSTRPEFKNNANSLLKDTNEFTIGLTKYFNKNNLKIQTVYSNITVNQVNNLSQFEVIFQIAF